MPLLKELLIGLDDVRVVGDENAEVAAMAYDSRMVSPGTAFVAVRGHERDGHTYIDQAVARGASVIVADNEESVRDLPENITRVFTPDTRRALALLGCEFYEHPSHELFLVGVTGTNGKTTTCHLIADILRASGLQKCRHHRHFGRGQREKLLRYGAHHARKP